MLRCLCTLSAAVALLTLPGCASVNKYPQTRDEFVSDMQAGGLFRNKGQFVVNRPVQTVVANARQYADKCLKTDVTIRLPREAPSTTNYRPAISSGPGGVTALWIQELYNGRPNPGAPAGGQFSFVAEMRAASAGTTHVDAYWITTRGKIVDSMKPWLEAGKGGCPALD